MDFRPVGPNWISLKNFFVVDGGAVKTLPPDARENVFPEPGLSGGEEAWYVVSFPYNTNRILRDFDWQKFAPWDVCAGETALSDAVLERIIGNESRGAVDFVMAFQQVGMKVAVLEAPRHFEAVLTEKSGRAPVLKAVSERYRAVLDRQFEAAGIPVLHQPAETIAESGSSLPEWKSRNEGDLYHANSDYGALMLEKMLTELD